MKMTREDMLAENRGFYDGVRGRTMTNPPHLNWKAGEHPNADYERGYWSGKNNRGEGVPHPQERFDYYYYFKQ